MTFGVIHRGITGRPSNKIAVQHWHKSISKDLRIYFVRKIVKAIFPTTDPCALMDKNYLNLVAYAKKVEGDIYKMAPSRAEYFRLLIEKIYKNQKELKEKRRKQKEQEMLAKENQNEN